MKGRKLVRDSLILSFVRILTLLIGILSTSILSHGLDLYTYGVYSQGNLLISVLTAISILGFTDAVNYFFNKFDDEEQRKRYINTLFSLQLLIGTILAVCVLLLQDVICAYFGADRIKPYLIYLCFRPLLSNYTAMLNNLYISVGRTKQIALRSVAVAVTKIVAICLCVFWTKDIGIVFLLLFLMDAFNVGYFTIAFSRKECKLSFFSIDRTLLKEILIFCIPVAVFILTNSLNRELDKWVIARIGGTEELAIYTNASLPLPLEIISASLMTIIIPILTRLYHHGKLESAAKLVSGYIKIGYITTAVFGVVCLIVSEELILLLYGSQYLPGMAVFRLYLIVDILKFANMSVLMNIAGKTKELMRFSVIMLAVNAVLNVSAYYLFGMIGPAVVTVAVTVVNVGYVLVRGIIILRCKFSSCFDWIHLTLFAIEMLTLGVLTSMFRKLLNCRGVAEVYVIISCGILFCGTLFLLNWREIKGTFVTINNLEEKENG